MFLYFLFFSKCSNCCTLTVFVQCSHYPKLIPHRFLFSYAEGCPSYLPWWLQGLETQAIWPIGIHLWAILTNQKSEELRTLRTWEEPQEKCSKDILREWQHKLFFSFQWTIEWSCQIISLNLMLSSWKNICAWCCVVQTVSLGLWQDVLMSDAAVLLLSSPPLASVSCSEYRTHFSYTHQLSENRYNQTHCLHMGTKICSINKSYLMFAKRILKIFTFSNLETLAFLS